MCDDETEVDNAAYLQQRLLNRRQVAWGAGAAVATVLTGCRTRTGSANAQSPASPPDPTAAASEPDQLEATAAATNGRRVTIATPDGTAEAFFVAPRSGRHPGVLLWPDVAGLREAFETMAARLAEQGYAVLAVNQYYRSATLPILTSFSQWRSEEGKAKLAPMIAALTAQGIAQDGAAFAAWLDEQPQVDTGRKLASSGYCMGGPFTFRTAAAAPERIGAIASFHGGGLVTENADSPHALMPAMKAAALVCVAQSDHQRSPEVTPSLHEAAKRAGITAEIEVYPAQHGWCVTDSPVYDQVQAERAWARMLATFAAHL